MSTREELIQNIVGEVANNKDFIESLKTNVIDFIKNMQTYKRKSSNFQYQPYVDYARKKQEDRVLMKQALAIIEAYSVEDYFEIVRKCVINIINSNSKADSNNQVLNCDNNYYQKYFDAYSKNFISRLDIEMNKKMNSKTTENNKVKGGDDNDEKLLKENKLLKATLEKNVNKFVMDSEFIEKLLSQSNVKNALKNAIKTAVIPQPPQTPPLVDGSSTATQNATSGVIQNAVMSTAPQIFDTQIVKDAVDGAIAANATILETVSDSVFQCICSNDDLLNKLKTTTTKQFDSSIKTIVDSLLPQMGDKKGGQRTRKRKNKSIKNIYIK